MRLPGFNLPNLPNLPQGPAASKPSLLDRILPPDPAAPERPTIPPPTCGTLPPELPVPRDVSTKPRGRRSR